MPCVSSVMCTHQNGAASGFEMGFCYRIPAPKVPGVPTKTRLESRLKKFKLHAIYDCLQVRVLPYVIGTPAYLEDDLVGLKVVTNEDDDSEADSGSERSVNFK